MKKGGLGDTKDIALEAHGCWQHAPKLATQTDRPIAKMKKDSITDI